MKIDDTTRSAMADAYETSIGASPVLEIRSGAAPTNTTDADTGTLLCSITLPSDWLGNAAAGVKTKNGTWQGTGTAGAGAGTNAGHYRLKSSGAVVKEQGNVTVTGGGGDMEIDNISIAQNQTVTVTTWTRTMPAT